MTQLSSQQFGEVAGGGMQTSTTEYCFCFQEMHVYLALLQFAESNVRETSQVVLLGGSRNEKVAL